MIQGTMRAGAKLVAACILTMAAGGCADHPVPQVSVAPGATAQIAAEPVSAGARWRVESIDLIGGQKPTVLGAPKMVTDGASKSIQFDGTKDGLILPVTPLAGMKAFTFEVLFKPASGGATEQRFVHTEDEAGNRMTVETRLTADGKWSLDTFLLAGASRRSLYEATKLHPADQWYWVALRYDGTTMSDFVDGVKELEGPVAFGPMGEKGRISLGVRLNQVNWFKGEIREVRIRPRALGETELQKVR